MGISSAQESLIQLERNPVNLPSGAGKPSRSTITSNEYLLNTLHVLTRFDRDSRGRSSIITGGLTLELIKLILYMLNSVSLEGALYFLSNALVDRQRTFRVCYVYLCE